MKYLTWIIFLGFIYQTAAKSRTGQRCGVPDRERADCGFSGVTQSQCLQRGCCWVPCNNCERNIPWCFFSQESDQDKCEVSSEEKIDCGYYGIKQNECNSRGCCWKPSKQPNDPWCYNAKTTTTTTTTSTTTTAEPTTPEYGYEGMVRLMGGATNYEDDSSEYPGYTGRLEIYNDGVWGTVCDDDFTDTNAKVVCRQLGLYGGTYKGSAYYGEGRGQIWLDQVSCDGSEAALSGCNHPGWGVNDCSHSEDVSVDCDLEHVNETGETGYEAEIRLVNGASPNEGRVEVFHDGEWGTVCDDYFEPIDADVVCRQLGYSPASGEALGGAYFGEGSGKTWLDDVNCSGLESALSDCGFSCWECEDCGHSEDVGVRCLGVLGNTTVTEPVTTIEPVGDIPEGTLRLAEGTGNSEWSGRLEIYHNNRWGTVCDDDFGVNEAQVACRQLGLAGGRAKGSAYFGAGEEPTWLDGVWCDGNEERLLDCRINDWEHEDCSHDEDIGLICNNPNVTEPMTVESTTESFNSSEYIYSENHDVRINTGGDGDVQGLIEVRFNDTWGTVCDNTFNTTDATVFCGMFGLGYGTEMEIRLLSEEVYESLPIWMDLVQCSGNETSIYDCPHRLNYSNCTHDNDVYVICYS